ncbi:uncharacterized protein LAESUDRAFT_715117 [Laetiporus sulphureus 93-53]|uniref:Uncharacterized protein n=1 Tax=Laetiporus sulphureus 93-53 TaxID=1314785 RepID=A0A165DK42_9APHY|nr:uncharacterized protein LAESUDRAFT_715117 [Laetiporus sulphureus 93-53]KZT05059.1 hypothetical protein LAESUDRAFT_715117 [Laetiporus sulphureus 93-53]
MNLQKPAAKTRKLTDKNLPNALLQSTRVLSRLANTSRTLRIFLSHTVSGQTWQQGADGLGAVGTTEGEAGKLPNQRAKERPPPWKFLTLIKQMVVELEPSQPQLDRFTVRRKGDTPVKIRFIIHLEQQSEQFKVHLELGSFLALREESRVGVVQALWNYRTAAGLSVTLHDPSSIVTLVYIRVGYEWCCGEEE